MIIQSIPIFKDMLHGERRMSHNTVSAYVSDVCQFLKFCNYNLNPESLYQYFDSQKYSAATTSRKISSIVLWMKFCQTDLDLDIDLKLPKVKVHTHLPAILSNKDLTCILEYLNSNPTNFKIKMLAIVQVLYSSGMRVSELLQIKLNQFTNMQSNHAFSIIGKGNKERIVFLTDQAINAVQKYLRQKTKESEYLFSTNTGLPLSRQYVHQQLKTIAKYAKVPVEKVFPHSFRHRLGSNLNQKGMNLAEIKEIFGHSKIATTLLYTHLEDEWMLNLVKEKHPLGKK